MRELNIHVNEAGQRLDKYLKKYFKEAPGSFIYKMLRKKNIVLNGKKADGSEKLSVGDKVKLFLAEETIEKFSGGHQVKERKNLMKKGRKNSVPVIYEDDQVLFLNKPSGMLSQKAKASDFSLNEYVISYLLEKGEIAEEALCTFRPSVCNRLDRNTSGIVAAGKTLAGLQELSELFRNRNLKKYYLCIVKGKIEDPAYIDGFLKRDLNAHKVTVVTKEEYKNAKEKEQYSPIETEYLPLAYHRKMTLLKVHLITGRTHQIRAHLAFQGHPVVGDFKYGDRSFNEPFREKYRIEDQLLHAYELKMPELTGALKGISQKTFTAEVPPVFWKVIKETSWEHGIQEALEVQHLKI